MAIEALTVLTPVAPGRERPLRELLAAISRRERSPLAHVAGTHAGRWTVVAPLRDRHDAPIDGTSYLLFASWFDGRPRDYPLALAAGMPVDAEAIWRHCTGFPGVTNERAFRRYLLDHRIKPSLALAGYPDATLPEVLDALSLRERLSDFAVRTQGLDPLALRREWRAAFPRGGP